MTDTLAEQIYGLDAVALADLVRQREVSAKELLSVTLQHVDKHNPQLNAVVERFDDLAESHATECNRTGSLAGVPIFLKVLWTACTGAPLSIAGELLRNLQSPNDSHLTARLKASGAVIAGMSNSPEMGLVPTTEPRRYGATHNPWEPTLSPGGSSGGAAAIIAAGITPLAHGSDGGGSIRIPAACCGLVGMKPSRGRVSFGPDVGEGWGSMANHGCISQTVRDTAAFLDVVAGPEPGDPYTAPPPPRPYLEEIAIAPGPQRIGLCLKSFNGQAVDPECVDAVRSAATKLQNLGHELIEIEPPVDPEQTWNPCQQIVAVNVANSLANIGRMRGRDVDEEEVERWTWWLATEGRVISGAAYVDSVASIHSMGRQVAAQFSDIDLILTPTMAVPEIPLGHIDVMSDDHDTFASAVLPTIAFTSLFNATGQPAISLPIVTRTNGLPIGVQLVAPYGEEGLLFRMAAELETSYPWAGRTPAIHITNA